MNHGHDPSLERPQWDSFHPWFLQYIDFQERKPFLQILNGVRAAEMVPLVHLPLLLHFLGYEKNNHSMRKTPRRLRTYSFRNVNVGCPCQGRNRLELWSINALAFSDSPTLNAFSPKPCYHRLF
ncbi:predicted protein [Histoplasma capsulatum G186AR]|uniref:Uncharacterized protein n=1 Tax=Ajellomyces capsulatus (strain G186AR / H82 / ATCC MYA-2454 / RMSCC 2432) TaxID=447093 RepID=C0NPM3_AJECG|nr:uncharacterized protein HCBG_05103 [Histoplasma capsulatum G186AR]EEH06883.1 predicted protein [Histoplasma capsulatum G186AR]